jgi:hypothetical protein
VVPQVDAALAGVAVPSHVQGNAPAHVEIAVTLAGGTADLEIMVTVVGLNRFDLTSGGGEGPWSCVATTPLAGAGNTAELRCNLDNARPGDPLALGLDLRYSGDSSVGAALAVLGPVVDLDVSDNTASAVLPRRN